MAESYKEIELTCPICKTTKNVRLPLPLFTQKRFGTVKVQVPQKGVCIEHQFIAFIDAKGIVRGYEKIDLLMKTELSLREKAEKLNLNTFINMFGLYGIFNIIHAKIFNYQIYIMKIKKYEKDLSFVNQIVDNIIPEDYRYTNKITFLEEMGYNDIKLKEKDAFLIDVQQNILQTPWDVKMKFKFEEDLIERALEIFDDKDQLALLQQGILKLIKEAEYVKNVLEGIKVIYEDDLIDRISQDLMEPRISHYRLELIKEFIKRRFSEKLTDKIKSKVEDFLILL
jgi:sulfur transfer complex TusBCD TusB component (DsrH family)